MQHSQITCDTVPCIVMFLIMLVLGCGNDGRHSLQGVVTVDGAPLQSGYIQFRPLPGTSGPTAGGEVRDGEFIIPADGGTFTGQFRVEITATRATDRMVEDDITRDKFPAMEQYLPPSYNRDSQLTALVTAVGPNFFELALKMRDSPTGAESR